MPKKNRKDSKICMILKMKIKTSSNECSDSKRILKENKKCFSQPKKTENSSYSKNPKISDTRKFDVIILKVEQDGFSLQ